VVRTSSASQNLEKKKPKKTLEPAPDAAESNKRETRAKREGGVGVGRKKSDQRCAAQVEENQIG